MNVLSKTKNVLLLLIGLTVSTLGHAQAVNVGITMGLTGVGLEVSKPLNNYLSVRADMFVGGSVNFEQELENNTYTINYTPETNSLLLDIHPFKGVFYLTAGLVNQNISLNLASKLARNGYTFNQVQYSSNVVDEFTGAVGFSKSTAPYIGMGWSNRSRSTSGFAFSFEVGAIDAGTGKVSFSIDCGGALSVRGCESLQSNVTAEEDEINRSLNDELYYPVVRLGLSYRF